MTRWTDQVLLGLQWTGMTHQGEEEDLLYLLLPLALWDFRGR